LVIREQLETIDLLQGGFSLLFVIINIIVGSIIISRYFEHKRIEFLFVGLAWTGLGMPWVPDSINFIMIMTADIKLPIEAYLIIGTAPLPFFIILWLAALLPLLGVEKAKINMVVIFSFILSILFEVIFFMLLVLDKDQIGKELGPFHYEFGLFIEIFLLVCITIILITGLIFARESLKSDNKEINLKGKLLIIAFIFFMAASILDSQGGALLNPVMVVSVRVLLITSALFFYTGFVLPNWVKKLLLKNN